jgi:hypothetical protein
MKKILITFSVLFVLTNVYAKETKQKENKNSLSNEVKTKIIPFIGTDVGVYIVTPTNIVIGLEHSFIEPNADKILCMTGYGDGDLLCLSDVTGYTGKLYLENTIDASIGIKRGNFIFTFDLGFNKLKAKNIVPGYGEIEDDDIAFTFGVNFGYLFENNIFLKAGCDFGSYKKFSYDGEEAKLGELENESSNGITYRKGIFLNRYSLAIGVVF